MGTPTTTPPPHFGPIISRLFTKGNYFLDFLFAFLNKEALRAWVFSWTKEISSRDCTVESMNVKGKKKKSGIGSVYHVLCPTSDGLYHPLLPATKLRKTLNGFIQDLLIIARSWEFFLPFYQDNEIARDLPINFSSNNIVRRFADHFIKSNSMPRRSVDHFRKCYDHVLTLSSIFSRVTKFLVCRSFSQDLNAVRGYQQ